MFVDWVWAQTHASDHSSSGISSSKSILHVWRCCDDCVDLLVKRWSDNEPYLSEADPPAPKTQSDRWSGWSHFREIWIINLEVIQRSSSPQSAPTWTTLVHVFYCYICAVKIFVCAAPVSKILQVLFLGDDVTPSRPITRPITPTSCDILRFPLNSFFTSLFSLLCWCLRSFSSHVRFVCFSSFLATKSEVVKIYPCILHLCILPTQNKVNVLLLSAKKKTLT